IQEQNSYAGLTNKWLASRVSRICVAYENMDRFFPTDKMVFTGNPVRSDIVNTDDKRSKALDFFGLNPLKPVVLAIGGSLGARTINQSILASAAMFEKEGIQILWQCGKFYHAAMQTELIQKSVKGIHLHEFIREMDLAYAAADVVISRAGALSIAELCLVKKPVIFVPSPNVAEDHQTKNAMALVSKKAALMVKDAESIQELGTKTIMLVKNETLKKSLSKNIEAMAVPDATDRIVNEIVNVLR
ncbi:MAG: glycosyltransferase, partial [Cyclobacteriaceae bacterium]